MSLVTFHLHFGTARRGPGARRGVSASCTRGWTRATGTFPLGWKGLGKLMPVWGKRIFTLRALQAVPLHLQLAVLITLKLPSMGAA